MNILILGSGGREHALAWAICSSPMCDRLFVAPGNPGIGQIARNVDLKVSDHAAVIAFCRAETIGLVVVGPEAPLAIGLVDHLQHLGVPVFGPTMGAAKVETSKADTKALMMAAGIPTARAETHKKSADAKEAVRTRFGVPVVIKASGLAAGKGVIICHTLKEADAAIEKRGIFMIPDFLANAGGVTCSVTVRLRSRWRIWSMPVTCSICARLETWTILPWGVASGAL